MFRFLVSFLLMIVCSPTFAAVNPYEDALTRLDQTVNEKVEQLGELTRRMAGLARKACADESVVSFFDINLRYVRASLEAEAPAHVAESVETLRAEFVQHYVENYFAFHDILFISPDGTVFYSMRKESDLYVNLTDQDTALGQCIGQKPETETFVDFHYYAPSAEPAAFFLEPIRKNDKQIGWIALQCAINKMNSLFVSSDGLGQTGETFLVNEAGFMLTESFFVGSSTILKKHLDDRNIQAKFKEQQGHRTVTDYRGSTALSSFEVFPFMGIRWLIVAKVDKDEVVTKHYWSQRQAYADRIVADLKQRPTRALPAAKAVSAERTMRVDMDEFLKSDQGEPIETFGISTCTGLLMAYPKRFAYLAHASPKDKLYGGTDTNLLGQMTTHMQSFCIYPYEKRNVVFVFVAPHLETLPSVVNGIVNEGFQLSQIYVLYNPTASLAAMVYDYDRNDLVVTWQTEAAQSVLGEQSLTDAVRVSSLVEDAIATEL